MSTKLILNISTKTSFHKSAPRFYTAMNLPMFSTTIYISFAIKFSLAIYPSDFFHGI